MANTDTSIKFLFADTCRPAGWHVSANLLSRADRFADTFRQSELQLARRHYYNILSWLGYRKQNNLKYFFCCEDTLHSCDVILQP